MDFGIEGSRHYLNADFNEALKCFTEAIKINPENPVMFSNRALTFIALDKPQLALLDAEKGLSIDPTHIKLMHRKATSLLKLNKVQAAVSFLEDCCKKHSDLEDLLLHAKSLLQKSSNNVTGCPRCCAAVEVEPVVSDVITKSENPGADGTCYFRKGDYKESLSCYTEAIKREPSNPVLFSNRAAAYLALNKPQLALADAETGLSFDATNFKLIHRKAKSLLKLNRYQAAVSYLEGCSVKNVDLDNFLLDARSLLEESKTGNYDLLKMIKEGKRSPYLDHADYINPAVRVLPVDRKGRGLVALKALPAGTLICACKAFAFCPKGNKVGDRGDPHLNSQLIKTSVDALGTAVCVKLQADPSQTEKLYNLCHGHDVGVCCIKCGLIYPAAQNFPEAVHAVVNLNMFFAKPDYLDDSRWSIMEPLEYVLANSSCGLWIFPAFINHACCDQNCFQTFIGDFMFLRTTKDVKENEELVIEYFGDDIAESASSIESVYVFKCECRLCKLIQSESNKAKTALQSVHFLERLNGDNSPAAIKKLKSALLAVKEARPDLSLNFDYTWIMHALASKYAAIDSRAEAISWFEKCIDSMLKMGRILRALGEILKLSAFLCKSNLTDGDKKISEKWQDELLRLSELFLGDYRLLEHFIPLYAPV